MLAVLEPKLLKIRDGSNGCRLKEREVRRKIRRHVQHSATQVARHVHSIEEQPHPAQARMPLKPAVVKRKGSASDIVAASLA
jgi:hypothetical protein